MNAFSTSTKTFKQFCFLKKQIVKISLFMLVLFCNLKQLNAQCNIQALTSTEGTGNQAYTERLGRFFSVDPGKTVVISALGAYDSDGDGFAVATTIRVGIYSTSGTLQGVSRNFTNANPGTLSGSDIFRKKNVTPFTLTAGNYVIVAVGFNANDKNRNTTQPGGGLSANENSIADITWGASGYGGIGLGVPTTPFADFEHAGTFVANPINTAGAASSAPSLCINTALTSITHVTTNATGITLPTISNYDLPAGVSASWSSITNTITISGTPTVSGTFNYIIPLSGGCGTVNATGTIIVNPLSVGGTTAAATTDVCSGTNSTTITLTGHTGNVIRWQRDNNAAFSSPANIANTTTSFTATNLTATRFYRAVVQSAACPSNNSSGARVRVLPLPTGSIISATNTTICAGEDANIIVSQSGALDYNGVFSITTSSASGVSTPSFAYTSTVTAVSGVNIPAANLTNTGTSTISYDINWVSLADDNCSATATQLSGAVTIRVRPNPTATISSSSANECKNATEPIITFTGFTGTAPYTFEYTLNGTAQTPVTTTSFSNRTTVNVPTINTGLYSYEITKVTEDNGCEKIITGQSVCVVVFPNAANAPTLNTGCSNNITITPPASVTNFDIEYSKDNGFSWQASNLFAALSDSCLGYNFKTRYVLNTTCGSNLSGLSLACAVSDSTNRKVDATPPTFTRPADTTIYKNSVCFADTTTSITGTATNIADNCSTGLQATYSDVVVQGCQGSYVITRTWNLVDSCSNAALPQIQTITVSDTTKPNFTTLAADLTVQCDGAGNLTEYNNWLSTHAGAIAADNCSTVTWTTNCLGLSATTFNSTITTPIAIPDGNAAGISNTIVIAGAGIINSPNDLTIGLNIVNGHTWVGDLKVTVTTPGGNTIVFDRPNWPINSSGSNNDFTGSYTFNPLTGTILPESTGNGVIAPGAYKPSNSDNLGIAHNWTGLTFPFNANGNWTINVSDNDAIIEGQLGGWSVIINDAGACSFTDLCGATGTSTVIFSATDACGNASTTTATFKIEDTTKPTFTQPADITLFKDANCFADTTTLFTGDVNNEADVCSIGLQATYTDSVVQGCQGSYVVSRTWSLADNCGNTTTHLQIITVSDTTRPTFTRPIDTLIYKDGMCNADTTTSNTGDVTNEADNCSTNIQATHSDVVVQGCQGSYVITRTWSLVDSCNNAAFTQIQTITVSDTTRPTFTKPANITIYKDAVCFADTTTVNTGTATNIADNCSTGLQATYSDAVVQGCQGSYVVTRTWSLVDNCMNVATQLQTITVSDTTRPSFTVPIDTTIFKDVNCNADTSTTMLGIPTNILDNCSSTFTTSYKDSFDIGANEIIQNNNTNVLNIVYGYNNAAYVNSYINTYTIPTSAANYNISNVTFHPYHWWGGNNYPVTIKVYTKPTAAAMDYVNFNLVSTTNTISGNSNFALRNIDINTTVVPGGSQIVVEIIARDFSLLGNTSGPPCYFSSAVNANLITVALSNFTIASQVSYQPIIPLCQGAYKIYRKWSVTDDCGNKSNMQIQTITIRDTTRPTFTRPADITLYKDANCVADTSSVGAGNVTNIADNCSTGLQATYSDAVVQGCEGSYVITRTWSMVDSCGNAAFTQIQTITVSDTLAPSLTSVIYAGTTNTNACKVDAATAAPFSASNAIQGFTDNCSSAVTATLINTNVTGTDAAWTVTYTFKVTDACGNDTTANYSNTGSDQTLPVAICTPITRTLSILSGTYTLNAIAINAISIGSSDNCSIASRTVSPSSFNCSNVGVNNVILTITDAAGNFSTCTTTVTILSPVTINQFGSTTNVTCVGGNNGSITVFGLFGTLPFTYSILSGPTINTTGQNSGVFTNLTAGVYTFQAQSAAGCYSPIITRTITQPTAITLAQVGVTSNVVCFGQGNGSATVAASGGGGTSYNYTISPNTAAQLSPGVFTGLVPGNYTISATNNLGCPAANTISITVTQPPLFNFVSSATNPTCFGLNNGTITGLASGGVGPYLYSLTSPAGLQSSGSFINLAPGNYTITAKDANGCTRTNTYFLVNPSAIGFAAAPIVNPVSCFGGNNGTIMALGSGGTGSYTYAITPNVGTQSGGSFTNLTAGNYIITVTDAANCNTSISVTVGSPTQITASPAVIVTNTTCAGINNGAIDLTVNASGGSPGYNYSYLWSNGVTTQDLLNVAAGNFNVNITVTDNIGCSKMFTVSVMVTQASSTLSASNVTTNVSCTAGNNGTIIVSTTGGALGAKTYLLTGPMNATNSTGSFANLISGSYNILVTDAAGCQATTNALVNAPLNLAPDLTINALTGSTSFPTSTSSRNMIISLTEIGGNPATSSVILISKIPGYIISKPNVSTMAIISGSSYSVDNLSFTLANYGPNPTLYYQLTFNNPGTVFNCSQNRKIGLTITRATPNIGSFSVTSIVGNVAGETNTSNNTTVKSFTGN